MIRISASTNPATCADLSSETSRLILRAIDPALPSRANVALRTAGRLIVYSTGSLLCVDAGIALFRFETAETGRAIDITDAGRTTNPKQADVIFTCIDAIAGEQTGFTPLRTASPVTLRVVDAVRRIDTDERVAGQEAQEEKCREETPTGRAQKVPWGAFLMLRTHHVVPIWAMPPPKLGRRLADQIRSPEPL